MNAINIRYMNEIRGKFPLQEASNRYDAAHGREKVALGEVTEAEELLRDLTDEEERKIARELMAEAEQAWEEAMADLETYAAQIEEVLEDQGIEQMIDQAGALLRAQSAAQEVVAAQRAAADAVDELKASVENPVSDEERMAARARLDDVVSEAELGLSSQMKEALEARVARWMREGNLEADELRDRALAAAEADRTASAPKAWSGQSWVVR